jgi:hypothetical protein
MATKDDIESIVQWLEGVDEDQWHDQIELASEAISELRRIARGSVRGDKTGSRSAQMPTFTDESKKASPAIQQVNAMIVAMRRRDRKLAVAYGRAALALL